MTPKSIIFDGGFSAFRKKSQKVCFKCFFFFWKNFRIVLHLFICVYICMCVHACYDVHVDVRTQLVGICSLLSPCGFHEQIQVVGVSASALPTEALASPCFKVCVAILFYMSIMILLFSGRA